MRTLAVLSRKGGTGKSTVALCLAIAGHLRGLRVLIADVDPQASSVQGFRHRDRCGPALMEASGGKVHQVRFAAELQGVDLLIIDTPGTSDANTLHAIHASDLCLIVARPNYFDIAGAVSSAGTIRQLSKPGLVAINQAPPDRAGQEPSLLRNAREALAFTHLPIAATALRSRAIYSSAIAGGLSPEECEPGGQAAMELDLLWGEVAHTLGLGEADGRSAVGRR